MFHFLSIPRSPSEVSRRTLWSLVILLATLCGMAATWLRAPVLPFGICAYALLTLVSGGALYILVSSAPRPLVLFASAAALSPVIVAMLGTVAMLAGLPVRLTALILTAASGAAGIAAVSRARFPSQRSLTPVQAFLLLALFAAVVSAIGYLPFTREWWRMRADAWFHAAVVSQISQFGLPPEDPYTAGLPLQYMWFFHVYVLIASAASGIGSFMIMAAANVHAVIAFGLGAYLLSETFRKSFMHNYAATLTVIFGMNAGFWFFLPVRILRSFTGETRGLQELSWLVTLEPFNFKTARAFVMVSYNQPFLLDKFMVATALSPALASMALLWYAATRYLSRGEKENLILVFLAAFGVVAMHTALGVGVFAGLSAAAGVLFLLRRRWASGSETGRTAALFAVLLSCAMVMLPYLLSLSRVRDASAALPFGFSLSKMFAVVTSCALVLFLAAFQLRGLFSSRDAASRFLILSAVALLGISAILELPSPNQFDKLPFLLFFHLAILGGWTLADYSNRAKSASRRVLRMALASLLAFAPLNVLMFAAYYNTAPVHQVQDEEQRIVSWVREHTPRDAVFLDTAQGAFLVAAGPRRYLLGSETYAEQWGYDRAEIATRKRILEDVYSPGPLEQSALNTLRNMPWPVYAIVRKNDPDASAAAFEERSEFRRAYAGGSIWVYEFDKSASETGATAPSPVSPDIGDMR